MASKFAKRAPNYSEHRKDVDTADTVFNDVDMGIKMTDYKKAHIQVVPSGGANPTVKVKWWSEAAQLFIDEHTAISKAGVGVNTPYEFTVDCEGRIMLVDIDAIAAGTASVYVAGSDKTLER